jgi:sec-independent protein translocase protein TatB
MFGLGMGEILVILIVALLVLGPEKLPDAAKQIGKTIRELRKHTQNLQETIEQDEHIGGTVRELRSALRGDALAPWPKPAAPVPEGEKPVAQGTAEPTTPSPEPTATTAAATTAPATTAPATTAPATPAATSATPPAPEPTKHG